MWAPIQAGGSHLLAFGAGRTPNAGLTRQPRNTGHAWGAWVPGAASIPLAKRRDKAGMGWGAQSDLPAPQPGGVAAPLPPPTPLERPPPAPLTFCPFWPALPGLPWENRGMGQARASPKTGTCERGGHSPLCPGGHPGPSPPAVRARPAPSLPLQGPVAWEGTAHTTRPVEGTSRSECGFGDRSTAGGPIAPAALPISGLSHAMSSMGLSWGGFREGAGSGVLGVPITGLTFSPLGPRTPGSPLSPGIPCTKKPQQR